MSLEFDDQSLLQALLTFASFLLEIILLLSYYIACNENFGMQTIEQHTIHLIGGFPNKVKYFMSEIVGENYGIL